MSTPELKPCPFCGSNSIHIGTVSNTGGNITYLRCGNCSADGPWAKQETREAKWNTRHNPAESALNAAREAIEKAPHDIGCDGECTLFIGRASEGCTCWKAEALAQIDKALSPQQSKTT